jgi:recombination protein RecR
VRVARAVTSLIEAFERLPGIGPKTAARLTYYLLAVPEAEITRFADALKALKSQTVICSQCFNVAETNPCDICGDRDRDREVICVVEHPLDVLAIERGGHFKGVYHVLGGVIDPLHNIGPEEIRIGELIKRLSNEVIKEVILALNPNMEGEATCLYIAKQLKVDSGTLPAGRQELKVTRLAHGLPVGADIEYADEVTLDRAMEGRREI